MSKDIFDEFDIEGEIEATPLDLNVVKEKIPTHSSEKLCEMIVCDRYFGCYKEIAIMCMEELASRRTAGSDFAFEAYIEKAMAELPPLDFTIPDISDVLKQLIGKRK